MEYHFICIRVETSSGNVYYYNDVIDVSPMQFIVDSIKYQKKNPEAVERNRMITFSKEISQNEFKKFEDNLDYGS